MTFLILLAFYLVGFASGMLATVILAIYFGRRSLDSKLGLVPQSSAPVTGKLSVTKRMARVREITEEQLELMSRSDGPQKNSLDGKYKNGINKTVKDLEEEKTTILKSILTDGHDPEVTTMDETGIVTKTKLSAYMADSGITMDPKAETQPKIKKQGKFIVYKGGKDDSGNNSH